MRGGALLRATAGFEVTSRFPESRYLALAPAVRCSRRPLAQPCWGPLCPGLVTARPDKTASLEHKQEPPGQVQRETGQGQARHLCFRAINTPAAETGRAEGDESKEVKAWACSAPKR